MVGNLLWPSESEISFAQLHQAIFLLFNISMPMKLSDASGAQNYIRLIIDAILGEISKPFNTWNAWTPASVHSMDLKFDWLATDSICVRGFSTVAWFGMWSWKYFTKPSKKYSSLRFVGLIKKKIKSSGAFDPFLWHINALKINLMVYKADLLFGQGEPGFNVTF